MQDWETWYLSDSTKTTSASDKYFGKFRKNRSPENNPILRTQKQRLWRKT